jgi:hypothetical protein
MPSKEYEHFKNFSSSNMPMDERRKIWMELSNMTEGDFDKLFADQKETVKLSDLRGKPVALVFGSYT